MVFSCLRGEPFQRCGQTVVVQNGRRKFDAEDFRAACWLLERSYPGEYARTETRIIEQKAEEQKMGGCTILYNVGNHTLAEFLDFPTMDDPPEVAAEKQRRLLEMTPAKNAPVSA